MEKSPTSSRTGASSAGSSIHHSPPTPPSGDSPRLPHSPSHKSPPHVHKSPTHTHHADADTITETETETPLPLTPPPTPPYQALLPKANRPTVQPSLPSCAQQHQQAQFNVRQASARCRQMDGYVSFAAVEGLGEPPDSVDDGERPRRVSFRVWCSDADARL
jgi:hypothetical protein